MLHILLKIGFTKITHAEAVFLNWDSLTPCKVEQPLKGMELQQKEEQKDQGMQKISLERTYS